ncbi:hypothetical protein SEPCBS119000_006614 [Sporothrix epigloea]|uniref:Uncharacterized protein n=1 Tax=Sporothrix epigloea TaxID=1892477 RepID=A0ABP0E3V7_9PEZI
MPDTDALAPPLTPEERAIVKSYGSWTHFMICVGLKPYDFDDIDEAKRIVADFVVASKEHAEEQAREEAEEASKQSK